jgi:nucleotide-binding universal stress UspA family protein
MIRKILLPLDLSSGEPVKLAVRFARVFPCELVFLHCLPSSPLSSRFFFPGSQRASLHRALSAEERRPVEEKIARWVDALAAGDLRQTLRIVKGAVLSEVLGQIDALHPDWIIQGRRASPGREEWLSGGISRGLMEESPCPVITVNHAPPSSRLRLRPQDPSSPSPEALTVQPPPESAGFRRLILLTAFGESSVAALNTAAELSGKTGAELVIVHLQKDVSSGPASDLQDRLQLLAERAAALQKGLRVSPLLFTGNPEDFIGQWIGPGAADLVVMGMGRPREPAPFQHRFVEIVSRKASCPVMTVNAGGVNSRMEKRYRKIYQKLTPEDLLKISDEQPETVGEELFGGRRTLRPPELFLKYYSQAGLTRILEEYGIFPLLRQKGFADPQVILSLDDPFRQRLRIGFDGLKDEGHLLVEMVLHEGILESGRPGEGSGRGHYFSVLMVEWLLMQNPRASFTRERPPLPGQRHPGLGLSREILQLISLIGLRIGMDGIAIHPQHVHAALLYHRLFSCYNPVQEGQLCALLRDTESFNLDDVSWAVELDCLCHVQPERKASWHIDSQVRPLTDLLRNHFHTESYRKLFWESLANHHYRIDWPLFEKRFQNRVRGGLDASTGFNRSSERSVRAVRSPDESVRPKRG